MNVITPRKTPYDDPTLKQTWIDEHTYNTSVLNLSNRESYRRISSVYGCSWATIQYWTSENVRRLSIQHKKINYTPYSEQSDKRINSRRRHVLIRMDIQRNPHLYLSEIFNGSETFKASPEPKTLEQITYCLHQGTGIRISPRILHNYVRDWEDYRNTSLLEEISGHVPSIYKLSPNLL